MRKECYTPPSVESIHLGTLANLFTSFSTPVPIDAEFEGIDEREW